MGHLHYRLRGRRTLTRVMAVLVGFGVALTLFILLGWLIQPPQEKPPVDDSLRLNWAQVEQEQAVQTRKPAPDKPDMKPPEEQPQVPTPETPKTQAVSAPNAVLPAPDLSLNGLSSPVGAPSLNGIDVGPSGPAMLTPVYREPPRYPRRAQRRGIEGWVELVFAIDAEGKVIADSMKVVGADPANVFDHAAKRAIARWRFDPLPDGQSGQRLVRQRLEFQL
ncbi:hypothetical protein BFW38_08660 [Terasakiispira papahanaumokuakeensis]|uniref:Protein TonB n=1 Tax=Terasakiispira papahanaumokuakeensis TaxID=197479 RepID=A0A1E2VAC9_9GAMM|nr:energy transducer TonB [Terasakiispira papahanaumokuakeensis]ODC03605.1 hypothetical protein BFW38_08660 [Terasakiispira papahanaumokuakeensis]